MRIIWIVEHNIAISNIISCVEGSDFWVVMIFEQVKWIGCLNVPISSVVHRECLRVSRAISLVRSVDAIFDFNVSAMIQASRSIINHWSLEELVGVHLEIATKGLNGIVVYLRLDVHIFVYHIVYLIESQMHFTFLSTDVDLSSSFQPIGWEGRWEDCRCFTMKSFVQHLICSH
jgi:hypothetical protein